MKWVKGIEAAVGRCPSKQVFLKIWQYSQENTSVEVSIGTPIQVYAYKYCKILNTAFL